MTCGLVGELRAPSNAVVDRVIFSLILVGATTLALRTPAGERLDSRMPACKAVTRKKLMADITTLQELYVDELKDLWSAKRPDGESLEEDRASGHRRAA